MYRTLTLALLLLIRSTFAQTTQQAAVLLEAEASTSPVQIELSWNQDAGANDYSVYRKDPQSSSWGAALATINDTFFVDQNVQINRLYDYRVIKSGSGYNGQGYAQSAIRLESKSSRGQALIFVESTLASPLNDELMQLQRDIASDGWTPELIEISADTTVSFVKSIILDRYENSDSLTMVYIIGHVPVPYSGNLGPDGHNNHIGAWPADVFYGDVDGNWTDQVIYNVSASDPRNHNEPGDGKYDQSLIPGDGRVELQVGRIDFSNLTYFNKDEVELTRDYLNRVHGYKTNDWQLPLRGLIDDNFGYFGGEAFASVGWRNFAPLVGKDNIFTSDYRGTLDTAGYLFSYGCGGGTHESAGGIGTSSQFSDDTLQTGFTMLFGSYFGDWDRQNNLLRSALAQGNTMTISWAGRPWWNYHFMGLGGTIGECAAITQSNAGTFAASYGAQFVHVAQLGDPSLRMSYLSMPQSMNVQSVGDYHVLVNWTASLDPVDGYDIYRLKSNGLWQKINSTMVTSLSYVDSCVVESDDYVYMVKSAQVESNYSGSFINHSLGLMDTIGIIEDKYPSITSHSITQPDWRSTMLTFEAQGLWVEEFKWYIGFDTLTGASFEKNHLNIQGISPQFGYGIEALNRCASQIESGDGTYTVVGLEDELTEQIRLYPNPTSKGRLFVEGIADQTEYQVCDALGHQVTEGRLRNSHIDISRLSAGLYFIEFTSEKSKNFKVLITDR